MSNFIAILLLVVLTAFAVTGLLLLGTLAVGLGVLLLLYWIGFAMGGRSPRCGLLSLGVGLLVFIGSAIYASSSDAHVPGASRMQRVAEEAWGHDRVAAKCPAGVAVKQAKFVDEAVAAGAWSPDYPCVVWFPTRYMHTNLYENTCTAMVHEYGHLIGLEHSHGVMEPVETRRAWIGCRAPKRWPWPTIRSESGLEPELSDFLFRLT